MAARFGDSALLQGAAGQQTGEGDGLGIGDQVAGGHFPPARIGVVRSRGLKAGWPQAFLDGPGLVPPGAGDGAGDFEGLHSGGGAAQQPDMSPLGLDQLRAPAKRHGQAAGSGQEQQPVPVACADPLIRCQVPACGYAASGACGGACGACRPPGRDSFLAAHQSPDRAGSVLAARFFPPPCGQGLLEHPRWNTAQGGYTGACLGVEVDLAVQVQHAGEVLLAADVGDSGEQVANGEVVAGGEPGQERQRQLSRQPMADTMPPDAAGLRPVRPLAGVRRVAVVLRCWVTSDTPYFRRAGRAGRAWASAAASSSTSPSSCLVIRSVPSVRAIRAASRMRWERLPIRPPVRAWR